MTKTWDLKFMSNSVLHLGWSVGVCVLKKTHIGSQTQTYFIKVCWSNKTLRTSATNNTVFNDYFYLEQKSFAFMKTKDANKHFKKPHHPASTFAPPFQCFSSCCGTSTPALFYFTDTVASKPWRERATTKTPPQITRRETAFSVLHRVGEVLMGPKTAEPMMRSLCPSRNCSIVPRLIMQSPNQVSHVFSGTYCNWYFLVLQVSAPFLSLLFYLPLSHSHSHSTNIVSLTMMFSALAVVYLNNEQTVENGEAAMAQAYQVFNTSNGGFDSFIKSFANSLIMVTVICMMTFVIVLLYKFKCMKCLIGYMMFCSCTLLGVMGGNLVETGLMIYQTPVDKLTFYFGLYNFAVVGVTSIFWGQGIPKYMTQVYLMATAVILAWHLSYFDSLSTWSLLIMLALYDLCAVLTPCGPLRFLVDLMSKEDAPEMPGLLWVTIVVLP